DPGVHDESDLAGAREGHLRRLFEQAGLAELVETVVLADFELESFETWWLPFTRGVGPAGSYVVGRSEARQAELREACRQRLPTGSFTLPARAWAVRGTA
ncbi:MAG TPA: hypothetical protein VKR24_06685, partial [Candidatus Limnocylindrales bacterium]|nr:hypothetical protein [Candidatus Limnocylindrales bacterium]